VREAKEEAMEVEIGEGTTFHPVPLEDFCPKRISLAG